MIQINCCITRCFNSLFPWFCGGKKASLQQQSSKLSPFSDILLFMDQFNQVTSSETGSVMREQCQSAHASRQAGRRAGARTHANNIHTMLVLGFTCTVKRAATHLQRSGPKNWGKDEVWIKKKCVPYCLCQVEVVTLAQDEGRKANKTQSVQNCRHNPEWAGFPCFQSIADKPGMIVSAVTVISFWPTMASVPAGMACSAKCYNRDQYL